MTTRVVFTLRTITTHSQCINTLLFIFNNNNYTFLLLGYIKCLDLEITGRRDKVSRFLRVGYVNKEKRGGSLKNKVRRKHYLNSLSTHLGQPREMPGIV